jgi:drug/metabolite transporter (DMT)-like permease
LLRTGIGVLAAALAALFASWAGLLLSRMSNGDSDMSSGFFATMGAILLAVAGLLAVTCLVSLSRTRHEVTWLTVAVAAFLASAVPYVAIFGMPGIAVHATLLAVAAYSAVSYFRSGQHTLVQ